MKYKLIRTNAIEVEKILANSEYIETVESDIDIAIEAIKSSLELLIEYDNSEIFNIKDKEKIRKLLSAIINLKDEREEKRTAYKVKSFFELIQKKKIPFRYHAIGFFNKFYLTVQECIFIWIILIACIILCVI